MARAASEATLEKVLVALDRGFDRRASLTSPGWELAETNRPIAFARARTIRTITDLQGATEIVAAADCAAGPTRLVEGMRLRMLRPTMMHAGNDQVWVDEPHGGRSTHQLKVEVPAGAEVTVTYVYPRGHATCFAAEWPAWIVGPAFGDHRSSPVTPLAPVDSYTLSFIGPGLEGADYVVVTEAT